jgi:hypothetical protein
VKNRYFERGRERGEIDGISSTHRRALTTRNEMKMV